MIAKCQKHKAKNEKIKRSYFQYLTGAQGFSPATVQIIEEALWKYEEFSNEADYATFNKERAVGFKKWLSSRINPKTKTPVVLSTQYHILRHIKEFFIWLSGQTGYKSRIGIYDIKYLRLDKKQSRIATSSKKQEYPSLDYVITLCKSIHIKTEIDRRDRALIAFTLLSGMRDTAIITLPMECFDPQKLIVYQLPAKGVLTKFSKSIVTTLFNFDNSLLEYILDWNKYLKEKKLFSNINPLFPKTKLEQKGTNDLCFIGLKIEAVFWKSAQAMRNIFKQRAKDAGLDYFSPHKLRHTAVFEAVKHCNTAEELRAISQNFGHENIGTTLTSYGKLDDYRIQSVISDINHNIKNPCNRKNNLDKISKEELIAELQKRIK